MEEYELIGGINYRVFRKWEDKKEKGYELYFHQDTCAYYLNFVLHRLDGPALIMTGCEDDYFINGKRYKENEFWTVQKKCFKCHQIFNNMLELKIHLEQYYDAKNMIEYIYELLLG